MRHRFTEPAGGTVQAEPEVYPRARSHRLYSVVSGVWRAMNGARRHAGGVGAVPLVLGPLCHVNGGAGDCRGPVIRIACGIVGRPVFRNGETPRKQVIRKTLREIQTFRREPEFRCGTPSERELGFATVAHSPSNCLSTLPNRL